MVDPNVTAPLIVLGPDFFRGIVQTSVVLVIGFFAKRVLEMMDRVTRTEDQLEDFEKRLESAVQRIQNTEERCFRVMTRLDVSHADHHDKKEDV